MPGNSTRAPNPCRAGGRGSRLVSEQRPCRDSRGAVVPARADRDLARIGASLIAGRCLSGHHPRELDVPTADGQLRRPAAVRLSAELCDCEIARRSGADCASRARPGSYSRCMTTFSPSGGAIAPPVQDRAQARAAQASQSLDAYKRAARASTALPLRVGRSPSRRAAVPARHRARSGLRRGLCSGRELRTLALLRGESPEPRRDSRESSGLSRSARTLDRFDPLALGGFPPPPRGRHTSGRVWFRDSTSVELFDRALAANAIACHRWLRSSATFSYIGETREARAASISGSGFALRRACVLQLRFGRAGRLPAGTGRRGPVWAPLAGGHPPSSATCASSPPGLAASVQLEEAARYGPGAAAAQPNFRVRASPRALTSMTGQRRLFGDHLMIAGLPEIAGPLAA